MLQKLLEAEQAVGRQLIGKEDILAIQAQWNEDFDFSNTAFRLAAQMQRDLR